jgi:hypothetical protein
VQLFWKLKIGNSDCFNGDTADLGTVTATETRYVRIKWEDGHESLTGHTHMERVELVKK